ncbi:TPA: metalloprotease [Candidatus Woesearchaeota archaeon]|nr:metalloprotease [Candidatus Woesearchaeota archaeon]
MSKTVTVGKIKTSTTELRDIAKAWLALSFAFAFVYAGLSFMRGGFSLMRLFSTEFLLYFAIALVTAGFGFLFHELAHKFVAQRYGCTAEFRAFDAMIYLAVGLAVITGFIFAAPGAVMIAGMITRKENGIISLAGPLTNYVLAMIFLGLLFTFPQFSLLFGTGFGINMWLGLFNLIPFGNFDGIKIFQWNIIIWSTMVAFGVLFLFFLF